MYGSKRLNLWFFYFAWVCNESKNYILTIPALNKLYFLYEVCPRKQFFDQLSAKFWERGTIFGKMLYLMKKKKKKKKNDGNLINPSIEILKKHNKHNFSLEKFKTLLLTY